MKRVVFLTAIMAHYRQPFHERVRATLAGRGVAYDLLHGAPRPGEAAKQDTVSPDWATPIRNRHFAGGRLVWQSAVRHLVGADLVVLGQENKLLINYPLQLLPRRLRPAVALFGHGRNHQARNSDSLSERWKRAWLRRCDWWFGYTEETRRHLVSNGFPDDRITVLNNVIDSGALRESLRAVGKAGLDRRRHALGVKGDKVGIFVGSLYADKRIDFLVEAAERVRRRIPDFELIVAGGGSGEAALRALAAERPWLKVTGPQIGADKAALLRLSKLFLMPGAAGLAIVDAAVAGLPVVTTAFPYHGPEIAYLKDGATGLVVRDWRSVEAYADAVALLLTDEARRCAMAAAASAASASFTIEAMAARFVEGVDACLGAAGSVPARWQPAVSGPRA